MIPQVCDYKPPTQTSPTFSGWEINSLVYNFFSTEKKGCIPFKTSQSERAIFGQWSIFISALLFLEESNDKDLSFKVLVHGHRISIFNDFPWMHYTGLSPHIPLQSLSPQLLQRRSGAFSGGSPLFISQKFLWRLKGIYKYFFKELQGGDVTLIQYLLQRLSLFWLANSFYVIINIIKHIIHNFIIYIYIYIIYHTDSSKSLASQCYYLG